MSFEKGHGDFGCCEKSTALVLVENLREHGVGSAGNEIADVFIADEEGHGFAEGEGSLFAGEDCAVVVGKAVKTGVAGVNGGKVEIAVPGFDAALKSLIAEVNGF